MLKNCKISFYIFIIFLFLVAPFGIYTYAKSAAYESVKEIECVQMSSANVVKEVFLDHQDIVLAIEKIGGNVSVTPTILNPNGCSGAAFFVIYYSNNEQRKTIKKMIGDTFFGNPYRMVKMF